MRRRGAGEAQVRRRRGDAQARRRLGAGEAQVRRRRGAGEAQAMPVTYLCQKQLVPEQLVPEHRPYSRGGAGQKKLWASPKVRDVGEGTCEL